MSTLTTYSWDVPELQHGPFVLAQQRVGIMRVVIKGKYTVGAFMQV